MNVHKSIRKYIANGEITGELEDVFEEGNITIYVGIKHNIDPKPVLKSIKENGGEILEVNEETRYITVKGDTGLITELAHNSRVDQLEPATGELTIPRYSNFTSQPTSRNAYDINSREVNDILRGVVYHFSNAVETDSNQRREVRAGEMYLTELFGLFGLDATTTNPYLSEAFENGKWISVLIEKEDTEFYLKISPYSIEEETFDNTRKYLRENPNSFRFEFCFRTKNGDFKYKECLSSTTD
jgi:hypothetical protein